MNRLSKAVNQLIAGFFGTHRSRGVKRSKGRMKLGIEALEDRYLLASPGVYLAVRDLVHVPHGRLGAHQFLVLVPENPDRFQGLLSGDLGDGTRGIVVSANNVGGRLKVQGFENPNGADFEATQQYFDPARRPRLIRNFHTLVAHVNLSGTGNSIDGVIAEVVSAAQDYTANEEKHHIKYPFAGGLFRHRCVNSNSWAQSVIAVVAGNNAVQEHFPARLDKCHQNRIPSSYFASPSSMPPPGPTQSSPFAGSYVGTYRGSGSAFGFTEPVSGPVALTVDANGKITVTVPGGGQGTVTPSGSVQFAGAGGFGSVGGANYVFTGTFVVSGSGVSASGGWSATFAGGNGSGTWTVSRSS